MLGLRAEGIQQAREALEIYQRLGTTVDQARCLNDLSRLLRSNKQLDAAKEAASHLIDLLPDEGEEYLACESQRLLGDIYRSKGERENAIHHFEMALAIASPFNWHDGQFWIHDSLAQLFRDERKFDNAHAHIEHAKALAVENAYNLGRAMDLQARIWYQQRKLKEAETEALGAFRTYEKLGAAKDLESCRALLQGIEKAMINGETAYF